jgi:hypothetical protein
MIVSFPDILVDGQHAVKMTALHNAVVVPLALARRGESF